MKTFLAGVLPNSLYLVCMPRKLKWTQRVWAANSQPPLSCAATGRCHTECWAGRPATTYTCACTRQFWRVSFFKALMAWPQHLLHFLKTDRLWSSTCSSHTAALSRNDRTHTEAGQLPRRGQQPPRAWTFPALSGRFLIWADSAATMEQCQLHSSAGAAGNSQMFY